MQTAKSRHHECARLGWQASAGLCSPVTRYGYSPSDGHRHYKSGLLPWSKTGPTVLCTVTTTYRAQSLLGYSCLQSYAVTTQCLTSCSLHMSIMFDCVCPELPISPTITKDVPCCLHMWRESRPGELRPGHMLSSAPNECPADYLSCSVRAGHVLSCHVAGCLAETRQRAVMSCHVIERLCVVQMSSPALSCERGSVIRCVGHV